MSVGNNVRRYSGSCRAALAELKKMEYKLDKEIKDMGGKIDNPLKEVEEERSKSSESIVKVNVQVSYAQVRCTWGISLTLRPRRILRNSSSKKICEFPECGCLEVTSFWFECC